MYAYKYHVIKKIKFCFRSTDDTCRLKLTKGSVALWQVGSLPEYNIIDR